jgi:hypothetical protein
VKAYLDLEEPVRDLSYMAGIAERLAWELLDGDRSREMARDDVIIRARARDIERAIFAIQKASDMAQALGKAFE